jgi:hypothetical protein
MTTIYIVSTEERAKENIYKLGKHTGTIRNLESRYGTPLIDPIIYFFYPTIYASIIENEIKRHLNSKRILNKNGNKSEWINLELKHIINIIFNIEKNIITENSSSILDQSLFYQKILPPRDFNKIGKFANLSSINIKRIIHGNGDYIYNFFKLMHCDPFVLKYHSIIYLENDNILYYRQDKVWMQTYDPKYIIGFLINIIIEELLLLINSKDHFDKNGGTSKIFKRIKRDIKKVFVKKYNIIESIVPSTTQGVWLREKRFAFSCLSAVRELEKLKDKIYVLLVESSYFLEQTYKTCINTNITLIEGKEYTIPPLESTEPINKKLYTIYDKIDESFDNLSSSDSSDNENIEMSIRKFTGLSDILSCELSDKFLSNDSSNKSDDELHHEL